ncbi:hypothetical protein NMG60_11029778 [Bertholletia excelsa]
MSFFFRVEASGDSEGDFDCPGEFQFYFQDLFGGYEGDDDAESCNCVFHGEINGLDVEAICNDHGDIGGGDCHMGDQSLQIEGSSRSGWRTVLGEEGEEESRRGVQERSSWEVMDEMERNRLFWETCLEEGLPVNYNQ